MSDVKAKISEVRGEDPATQVLICGGKTLKDDDPLATSVAAGGFLVLMVKKVRARVVHERALVRSLQTLGTTRGEHTRRARGGNKKGVQKASSSVVHTKLTVDGYGCCLRQSLRIAVQAVHVNHVPAAHRPSRSDVIGPNRHIDPDAPRPSVRTEPLAFPPRPVVLATCDPSSSSPCCCCPSCCCSSSSPYSCPCSRGFCPGASSSNRDTRFCYGSFATTTISRGRGRGRGGRWACGRPRQRGDADGNGVP